jgi:hypothetical protein
MLVASLVPGQQYDVLASSPAIKDATANTLATTSKLVRGPLSIQDTDVAVKQGWATVSSSFAYGKSYRSARISGATAQFTSTSRTFTINTVNGPGGGAANVYVGTVKVGTLATSAGATSHGAKTITLPGTVPTASSYAVRIVVSGTTSTGVRFDAVKIGSAARNDTPTATYTWSPISLSSTLHTIVHDLGTATAALRFKSTRVTATFVRSASSGKVTVSIDGVTKGTYDLYAGSTTPNYALSWSGLNGTVEHVITLKVTGTHRAGATGNKVFLDRMSVA